MNQEILSKNLKQLRKILKLTQDEFAEKLSITGSYISDVERGKSVISDSVLCLMEINYRINRNWLLKDEGEPFVKEWLDNKLNLFQEQGGPILDNFKMELEVVDQSNPSTSSTSSSDTPCADPWHTHITKTRFILESKTGYAKSLAANIDSFYDAVVTAEKLTDHEKRLAQLEKLSTVGREKEEDSDAALAAAS